MLEEQIDIEKHFKTLQNRKMGGGFRLPAGEGSLPPSSGGGKNITGSRLLGQGSPEPELHCKPEIAERRNKMKVMFTMIRVSAMSRETNEYNIIS